MFKTFSLRTDTFKCNLERSNVVYKSLAHTTVTMGFTGAMSPEKGDVSVHSGGAETVQHTQAYGCLHARLSATIISPRNTNENVIMD